MNYLQTDTFLLSFELGTVTAFLVAVWLLPQSVWHRVDRWLRQGVERLSLEGNPLAGAVLIAGLLTLICDFAFAALVRLPEANYHDEFSYLLAGETFASGRLTNPTPALERHFESFHILTSPSYQSKYPPGQGLALALGIVVSGFAGLGVWLSHAVAVAGICWFLGQFAAVRWALFGSLAFGLHDRVVVWWGQTYWGGAVAALGGALVFGGFARWLREGGMASGLIMGVGAGILALSRPAEGALCCLTVLAGIAARICASPARKRWSLIRISLVGGVGGVAPLLCFCLLYNYAVTGDSLRLPYQAWIDQYQIGLTGPAESGQGEMTSFAEFQHEFFSDQEYRYHTSFALWKLAHRLRPFYLPGLMLLALIGLRLPKSLSGAVLGGSVCLVLLFVTINPAGGFPHYLSPVTAPLVLGVVVGLRRAACCLPRAKPGVALAALAICILISLGRLAIVWPSAQSFTAKSVESSKRDLSANLEARQVDGLVLMLYGDGHLPAAEYVYNGPELRKSSEEGGPRVVWARALGEALDRELVLSYPKRAAYVYYLDERGGTLVEFAEFAAKNSGYSLTPASGNDR